MSPDEHKKDQSSMKLVKIDLNTEDDNTTQSTATKIDGLKYQ